MLSVGVYLERWVERFHFFWNQIRNLDQNNRIFVIIDKAIFGKTCIWDYIQNLTKCLPGEIAKECIILTKESVSTDIGRGRAFFRIALNERAMKDYLAALIYNQELTK